MSKWAKNAIVVVVWPGRGTGNDPETLGLGLHNQAPTFIYMYIVQLLQTWLIKTEVSMGVMSSLGQ